MIAFAIILIFMASGLLALLLYCLCAISGGCSRDEQEHEDYYRFL